MNLSLSSLLTKISVFFINYRKILLNMNFILQELIMSHTVMEF